MIIHETNAKIKMTYPYMGIHKGNKKLVWFVNPNSGVEIIGAKEHYVFGKEIIHHDETHYVPFNGTITFENGQ